MRQALCIIPNSFKLELWPRNAQFRSKSVFCVPCELEIIWKTLKNNKVLLLYRIELCLSLRSHQWIQTWLTVRKPSIRVKIGDFLCCVSSKFDEWSWTTIGHLFYAASGFVHHLIAISEFKLSRWYHDRNIVQKGVKDGRTDRQTDGRTDRQMCS